MLLALLQPALDDPVCSVHAKSNGSELWLWPDSHTVLLSGSFPALLQEETLEFTRRESFIFLSKSLFPGTHDSPNLYQRTWLLRCRRTHAMCLTGCRPCTSAYNRTATRVLMDGTAWSLTAGRSWHSPPPRYLLQCGSQDALSQQHLPGPLGSSLYPGSPESLYNKLCLRGFSRDKIRVWGGGNRNFSAWLGESTFPQEMI